MSPNEPEELAPPLDGGDFETGKALREFFVGLLSDDNLVRYHRDRTGYIDEWVRNERAADLLKSETFVEIESHILAVTGSSRAKPLFVVSPPY
ncbi:MAG: hypothetical protein ABIR67_04685 [Gaiellaceae bacterium]